MTRAKFIRLLLWALLAIIVLPVIYSVRAVMRALDLNRLVIPRIRGLANLRTHNMDIRAVLAKNTLKDMRAARMFVLESKRG